MIWPVDPQRYLLFLSVMTVFAVTPGPAVLFSVSNGVTRGLRAVVGGVAGINCASLMWFAAAGLGLGAVMAALPLLFRGLAWLGVAYLVWLGGQAVARGLGRGAVPATNRAAVQRLTATRGGDDAQRAWREGFLVQIVNPKVLLFFTTVLPPFLDLHRPAWPQVALFAATLVGLDTIGLSAYGFGGAALASRLQEPRNARRFALVSGLLLMAAASLIGLEQLAR